MVVMLFFGVVGYLLKKFRYDSAPLILSLVLGPQLEEAMHQSLVVSGGSFIIFLSRPISLILILISFTLLISSLVLSILQKKQPGAFQED
jgi:putative tricarboxylic transport membrane protein